MRTALVVLLATLSTACITLRVDIPDDLEFSQTAQGTWKVVKPQPTAAVAPSPVSAPSSPIVKAPAKAAVKPVIKKVRKAAPVKPTADVCRAKHEEANQCDAEVKVEMCKAACEAPPTTAAK